MTLSRIALALALSGTLYAYGWAEKAPKGKEPYAVIFCHVIGPDGHPVYGQKVKIRRADKTKGGYEGYTDHSGEFAQRVFPGPADYLVWIDLDNRQAADSTRVNVHISKDEQQDVMLHL